MNPKVVIVLLVIVVILFALAVGVGARQPEGAISAGGPDWLQSLGGWLGARQALPDEDVSGAVGLCMPAPRFRGLDFEEERLTQIACHTFANLNGEQVICQCEQGLQNRDRQHPDRGRDDDLYVPAVDALIDHALD